MSDHSLEHRIADAFASTLSSADLANLLDEVKVGAADAVKAKDEADRIALDPATRPEAVREARSVSEDAAFRATRFTKAVEGLEGLHKDALQREGAEARANEYAAAKAERDELAKDLQAYPKLIKELVTLLERLERSNARIAAANKGQTGDGWLKSAEVIARSLPADWLDHNPLGRPSLLKSKIVAFDPTTPNQFGQAWPDMSRT